MPDTLEPPASSQSLLTETIRSSFKLPVLLAADRAGIFASLDESPASSQEIAERFGISHRSAEAMLGVLAAAGFLTQLGGKFHLLDVAKDYLLPASPYYCGGWFDMWRTGAINHESVYNAIFEERAAYADVLDAENWESSPDGEQLERFTSTMHAASFPAAIGVATNGDFSGVSRLLDVAGGSGCFCIALASRYPDMALTVMELPGVCDIIPKYTTQYGLENRIGTYAADMFRDEWPADYDAHFLSNIFHDWDPDKCLLLAKTSYAALPPGGRLFLHEELANDTHDGPLETMLYSMNMVAWTRGGKQYSLNELEVILSEAGFRNVRVECTYNRFSLVIADKP